MTSSGNDRDVVTRGVHAGLQGLWAMLLEEEGHTVVEGLLVRKTIKSLLFSERPYRHGVANDENHLGHAIEVDGK